MHAFNIAPVSVQLVELAGKLDCTLEAVGDQTLNPDCHVSQPSRCIDAWTDSEAEIPSTGHARIFAGQLEECGNARAQPAVTNALQTLRDQNSVVAIQLHDIGNGAERDQIEQMIESGLCRCVERFAPTQLCSQREQNVEH